MKLNGFESFAFFMCSSIFGLLCSVWATTELITNREVTLLVVVFASVVFALLAQLSTDKALQVFMSKDVGDVHEKQLADVKEAHRRNVTQIKTERDVEFFRQHRELETMNSKFSFLYAQHDYINSMYQDQMRTAQEQEDRITYLETKLREAGQSTPFRVMPFSAPAFQTVFAPPPQRNRSHPFSNQPGSPNALSQVVEAEETEE